MLSFRSKAKYCTASLMYPSFRNSGKTNQHAVNSGILSEGLAALSLNLTSNMKNH